MRDVAVISFAQIARTRRAVEELNEVEMLMPVIRAALDQVDLTIDDIGFTCSGSTDYLAGVGFCFVSTLDGVGPWPPIQESHVEMDGAWALYEAWVKLQLGRDRHRPRLRYAQVVARRPAHGADPPARPRTRSARCGPTRISLAALQARAAARRRARPPRADGRGRRPQPRAAARQPQRPAAPGTGSVGGRRSAEDAPRRPAPPQRLPADHRRRRGHRPGRRRRGPGAERPPGLDPRHRPPHRAHAPRPPRPHRQRLHPASPPRRPAWPTAPVDVAELHAPFSHQELILRRGPGPGRRRRVNPSGGAAGRQPDDDRRAASASARWPTASRPATAAPGRGPRHQRPVPATEPRLRPGRRG